MLLQRKNTKKYKKNIINQGPLIGLEVCLQEFYVGKFVASQSFAYSVKLYKNYTFFCVGRLTPKIHVNSYFFNATKLLIDANIPSSPLFNFQAVQFMSQILVGLTFNDCWGTFQVQEVQAGFVRPLRLAASTQKSKAVTCIQELLILK